MFARSRVMEQHGAGETTTADHWVQTSIMVRPIQSLQVSSLQEALQSVVERDVHRISLQAWSRPVFQHRLVPWALAEASLTRVALMVPVARRFPARVSQRMSQTQWVVLLFHLPRSPLAALLVL